MWTAYIYVGVLTQIGIIHGIDSTSSPATLPTPVYNYNPNYFERSNSNISCETLCKHDQTCQGYIVTLEGIIPKRCQLAKTKKSININETLNTVLDGFSGFIPFECSAYTQQDVCFSLTKTCIACPEFPTQWQQEVESGYTVIFLASCCSNDYSSQYMIPDEVTASFNTVYNVTINNLRFTSPSNVRIESTQCPMFMVDTPFGITTTQFYNMSISCVNTSSSRAGVLVEYVDAINLDVENLVFKNVLSGITVLGGSQNSPYIIPKFSVTDLSNSRFSNITTTSDVIPVVAAVSLASYIGTSISLGKFDAQPEQLFVIQPGINDDNRAPTFINQSTANIIIFNISAFTQIFGLEYEISFSHAGAFEVNEESVALRNMMKYQGYIAVALISLMLILHQDLLFYYREDSKKEELEDRAFK